MPNAYKVSLVKAAEKAQGENRKSKNTTLGYISKKAL